MTADQITHMDPTQTEWPAYAAGLVYAAAELANERIREARDALARAEDAARVAYNGFIAFGRENGVVAMEPVIAHDSPERRTLYLIDRAISDARDHVGGLSAYTDELRRLAAPLDVEARNRGYSVDEITEHINTFRAALRERQDSSR